MTTQNILDLGLSGATGTGNFVGSTSPALVTPVLGTPTSGTLTNCTGLPVAGGGTGIATTTAYSVICAGTTATGAFQSLAALGASGTVLTSNGASALPSFQSAAGGSPGLFIGSAVAGTNTITLTVSASVVSYTQNLAILFTPVNQNSSTTVTVNVNGIGAATVYTALNNPLTISDLQQFTPALIIYNTSAAGFILVTPQQSTSGQIIGGNSNRIAFYTGSLGLAVTDNVNLAVDSNINFIHKKAIADQSYSSQAPTTGFSITIANNTNTLLLNPAGTLATGTITMPASPIDGQEIRCSSTQAITSLTVSANSGQSINNPPAALVAGGSFHYIYNASGTTWYVL